MSLLLCLSRISLGRYFFKKLSKVGDLSWGFGKICKERDDQIGGTSIDGGGGFKPFAHYVQKYVEICERRLVSRWMVDDLFSTDYTFGKDWKRLDW